MRIVITGLLLLVLVPAFLAQGTVEPPRNERAREAAAEYEKLADEVTGFRRAWQKEQIEKIKNRKPGDRSAISMVPPIGKFVKGFQQKAEEYAGTEEAVDFLSWLALNAGSEGDAARVASKTIIEKHLKSAKIGRFVGALPRLTRRNKLGSSNELLGRVIEENPDDGVKAQALFTRAYPVVTGGNKNSEEYASARLDMQRVLKLTADKDLIARAKGTLASRDKLEVGMEAPEIEGNDLDGVAFKLSDYRGKVILLDFWGDW